MGTVVPTWTGPATSWAERCKTALIAGQSFVQPALLLVQAGQIAVGVHKSRIEPQGFAVTGLGLLEPAQIGQG